MTPAQTRYIQYVKTHFPDVYASIIAPILSRSALNGMGDSGDTSWLDILHSVTDAIPAVASAYTASQAAQLAQATAQARAATIPATTSASSFSFSPTMIMVGVAALAAILLVSR